MLVQLKANLAGPGVNALSGDIVIIPDKLCLGSLDPEQEKLAPANRSLEYKLIRDEGLLANGTCEAMPKGWKFEDIKDEKKRVKAMKRHQDLTAFFDGELPDPSTPEAAAKKKRAKKAKKISRK